MTITSQGHVLGLPSIADIPQEGIRVIQVYEYEVVCADSPPGPTTTAHLSPRKDAVLLK